MIMGEAAKFCENELAPLDSIGDEAGCTHVDEQTVKTPPGYKEAYARRADDYSDASRRRRGRHVDGPVGASRGSGRDRRFI